MLSSRTALAAAALLSLLSASPATTQGTARPRKRIEVVTQGMTPAQVREVLGEPLRTRQDGGLTYMYYANGCERCGGDDYVVVRDCRVVGARFENPQRFVVRANADPAPVPEAECRVSEAAAGEPPLAAGPPAGAVGAPAPVEAPRRPPPPNDAGPGGAVPAERPALAVADTTPLAGGRTVAQVREGLLLERPADHLIALPAASISSPTAFGLEKGQGFLGFGYQARSRYTHLSDGAAVLGAGVGDRRKAVALEAAVTSYSTVRGGGPLETGGVSFKLHREVVRDWSLAAGVENVARWGGSDAGSSPYLVATHVVRLKPDETELMSTVVATLGVGAGRFRSESDVVADHQTANVFAALGVRVAEPLSLTADWNGQDLFASASVTPFRRVPLVLNAGLADITGHAGDGVRFIASAALGFRYLPPFF